LREEINQLKVALADKTLEVDFFRGALRNIEALRQKRARKWRRGIYNQIREVMQLQGNLSVERMCHLVRVDRAGFYRHLKGKAPRLENTEVRSLVQQIAVEHKRRLGSPRMKRELKKLGVVVNHKRVERIMREDNLLAIRWRKFVTTTESKHDHPVYLNLASRVQVTGPNQLWVADITYLRLQNEFVYLAVLLDAFSRRVVGWAVERTMQARLTLTVLERAIADRNPREA